MSESGQTPGTGPPSASVPVLGGAVNAVEEQLTYFKWMECVRQNDLAQAQTLLPLKSPQPLFLCASFGQLKMLELLLKSFLDATTTTTTSTSTTTTANSVNVVDGHGNSLLHYASRAGRTSILEFLLKQPAIDDSLHNDQGKDPRDVAKTVQVLELIEYHRRQFIHQKQAEMLMLARSQNLHGLQQLFTAGRVQRLVDINHQDAVHGETVLHIAAELNHLEMATWCLKMKADPLVRDKRGKLPAEKTKNDKIKQLLKGVLAQSAFASLSAPHQHATNSIRMQGMLYKWTNYASGYKSRWFVLEDGTLSYYRAQEDHPVACRGSVSLQVAKLWIDPADGHRLRFDVVLRDGGRWCLKAEHPMEAKRWVIAITEAKQWLQDHDKFSQIAASATVPPGPITKSSASGRASLVSLSESSDASTVPGQMVGGNRPIGEQHGSGMKPSLQSLRSMATRSADQSQENDEDDEEDDGYLETREKERLDDKSYDDHVQTLISSCMAGLQYQESLLVSLMSTTTDAATMQQLRDTFKKSLASLQTSIQSLQKTVEERERQWNRRYEREEDLKRLWEENLKTLAREHYEFQTKASQQMALLETKAKQASRNALDGPSSRGSGSGVAAMMNGVEKVLSDGEDEDEFFDATEEYAHQISAGEMMVDASSTTLGADIEGSVSQSASGGTAGAGTGMMISARGYPIEWRHSLPCAGSKPPEISLWSILRNNIGKDLSKIALPVFFNEPISMLQRMCEDMEYSTLLDIAASRIYESEKYDRGRFERLLFVAAFAMSNYSSTQGRTGKPFNPMLGETFEYVRRDRGFRYISEQVSHHPPISACFCESELYKFWGEVNLKNRIWGKSLEIMPQGVCHVVLKSTGEHFSWRKVTTSVNNLIVGTLYVDHYGDMVITNHANGDECLVRFKQPGWSGKGQFELEGHVKTKAEDTKLYTLWGKWDERLMCKQAVSDDQMNQVLKLTPKPDVKVKLSVDLSVSGGLMNRRNSILGSSPVGMAGSSSATVTGTSGEHATTAVLWKRAPHNSDAAAMFNLTDFAATLNECPEELKQLVAPTDSRLRPDQRAMENGQYDVADQEKVRLEDEQRKRRHARSEQGFEWTPVWFRREVERDTNESHWMYKGGYWESRQSGTWGADVPRIF